MPVKKIPATHAQPKHRTGCSLTKLPEFTEVKMLLSNGLKPQEAVEITIPKAKKHTLVTFNKHVKAYIKEHQLGYDCYVVADIMYIVGR